MATISYSRQASPDEMAAEIDRRGRVIEELEAERDKFAESEKFWKEMAAIESRARCELQSELSNLKAERDKAIIHRDYWMAAHDSTLEETRQLRDDVTYLEYELSTLRRQLEARGGAVTEEAGWIDKEDVSPEEIYAAMLAAAPAPTEKEG